MDFGAEDEIQQYIQKHNLEDSINDYSYNKAKRDYKWTTFYKNLALHDTNKFVSIQMKKNFMPPVLRKQYLMGIGDKNVNRRVEVIVPSIACNQTMGKGKRTMIIPDSYEKEKFLRRQMTIEPEPVVEKMVKRTSKVATQEENDVQSREEKHQKQDKKLAKKYASLLSASKNLEEEMYMFDQYCSKIYNVQHNI